MLHPALNEVASSRNMIDTFLGYNHQLRNASGEFYDMQNLTTDNYPILSPRKKRGAFVYPTGITANTQGIIAKDALCYVNDGKFYINNYEVQGFTLTSGEKTMVSMGAYVVILPDKKYINTADLTDFGSIDASFTSTAPITYTLCTIDGDAYEPYVSDTEPDPEDHPLWLDTSVTPNSLKQYSASSSMWVTIATTYIKIACTGIGENFAQGDGVAISGSSVPELNNTMVLQRAGADYVIVIGIIDEVITQATPLTVKREMPAVDLIVESENRLWGCRYGLANDGVTVVNEIYASKLGDFKNWSVYNGVSTDSYTASCGTDGRFTGAATYGGYVLFFKENYVHKVYGNMPSNYQIQTTFLRGVQRGSSKSVAAVNGTLLYKSINGVCGFEGTLPVEMSSVFGDIQYTDAVAGANRDKYYISMKDPEDNYHLFIYDTARNTWHKEDGFRADAFCSWNGIMYAINNADKKIVIIDADDDSYETDAIEWNCESGLMGCESPDHKYISRVTIRLSAGEYTTIKAYMQYDSDGYWIEVAELAPDTLRSFSLTLRPQRCDHFRWKLEGVGTAKIFSITYTTEQGSDEN